MARQTKKILKKIKPKEKNSEAKKPEKVGKDYLLIFILSLTFFFMIIGWENFPNVTRGLYAAMAISLSATYANRHFKFTDTQRLWTDRLSKGTMAIAVVLFLYSMFNDYFGK